MSSDISQPPANLNPNTVPDPTQMHPLPASPVNVLVQSAVKAKETSSFEKQINTAGPGTPEAPGPSGGETFKPVEQNGPEVKSVPEKTQETSAGSADTSTQEKDKSDKNKDLQFENPYKLYGYLPSTQLYANARSSNENANGNDSNAKTWLILLLHRLMVMKSSNND